MVGKADKVLKLSFIKFGVAEVISGPAKKAWALITMAWRYKSTSSEVEQVEAFVTVQRKVTIVLAGKLVTDVVGLLTFVMLLAEKVTGETTVQTPEPPTGGALAAIVKVIPTCEISLPAVAVTDGPTVTDDVQVLELPARSVTVKVTVWLPKSAQVKAVLLKMNVNEPLDVQLSVLALLTVLVNNVPLPEPLRVTVAVG